MTPSELNEEQLVEKPAERTFVELGYETIYGPEIHPGTENAERESFYEVILKQRLRKKLQDLNPGLPDQAYDLAINQVEGISNPTLIESNRQFHQMILAGIKVIIQEQNGKTKPEVLKLVDFDTPENNEFLAVRQFLIQQHEKRRLDHVIFVNGIPLVLLEYKDPTNKNATIMDAYHQLGPTDYQKYIPKIFYYNTILVISDRTLARYGTLSAPFERFSDWNDPTQQEKQVANRLEILQKQLFNKSTILDVIKNFIEFENDGKITIKKIAQQHQYLAVNNIVKKTKQVFAETNENRIGVVWHTTGSGKSLTMIFYTNIISQLEKFENPTFVIITDRTDLDEQLLYFFTVSGFPYPKPPTAILEAESVADLREKLKIPAGKIIFTTIQKFQTTEEEKEGNAKYPLISERRNIIIIADEAHRSQYKKMAQNLQRALPNALKIGFTGTPIEKEDRSTTHVFGDVISAYKIQDAVRDRATVQISCESRLVTLHLLNKFIGKDYEEITQELDEATTEYLARKWTEFKVLVEDQDRIQTISKDIVFHFNEKQKVFKGKAMIAASTKLAAARYADIISKMPGAPECTCIISGATHKLDDLPDEKKSKEEIIRKHYKDAMTIDQLITRFKNEDDPLKLLIVCDMYLTGFDAPLINTMYVDKPLRDHNLIQAISRVNRVWKDKPGGTIIDYIGIADDLKKSLRAYAEDDVKGAMIPTQEIITYMKNKHNELLSFFNSPIIDRRGLDETQEMSLIYSAIDEIVYDEEVKKRFFENVTELTKAYAVCTPHPSCLDVEEDLRFLQKIRRVMAKATSNVPMYSAETDLAIQELVDKGIGADQVIKSFNVEYTSDKIDLNADYIDKIKKIPHKNLKVELAHKLLDDAIQAKFKRNLVKKKSFQQRIEEALSKYHGKFEDYDSVMGRLEQVAKEVTQEKKREEELQLSDEEIAFYDIVSKGRQYVNSDKTLRDISVDLTNYLKKNIKIDWVNQEQVKAEIRMGVRKILLKANLPFDAIESLVSVIMQQAENNYG